MLFFSGAASGARTRDLFVTNEMLYQLSYCGLRETCNFKFAGTKLQIYFLITKCLLAVFEDYLGF